jgi:hypothetical protein
MPKLKTEKDPFAALTDEFKDAVASSSPEEIMTRIAETAIAEQENQQAKTEDEDLAEKKAAATFAGEQYKEATKMNKLKIKYARRVLEDKGKA